MSYITMSEVKYLTSAFDDQFPKFSTFWLVSDVLSGTRAAPRSGHDVTGPDII